MKRDGSIDNKCYNKEKDLEYTNHILITILMCCGYDDLDPLQHSIDDVVEKIKEIFFTDNTIGSNAPSEIIESTRNYLLLNYRRFWFNHQLISAVN